MVIRARIGRNAVETEMASENPGDLLEVATLIRQNKVDLVPDWPEIAFVGQMWPSANVGATINVLASQGQLATFPAFLQVYQSLCVYNGLPTNPSAMCYVENLYTYGERDFVVADIPGADLPGSGPDKDVVVGTNLQPLMLALRYNRYFAGLIVSGIVRREVISTIPQIVRSNGALTRITFCNNDADPSLLVEMALSLKENSNTRIQMFDICDQKTVDNRFVHVMASMLTTYPAQRISHLSMARCGLSGKALTKLFQAFPMNHSVSVGISHLNLSGSKFDSDTVAALELWLETGGNYSSLEELTLSDVSNFPFKVLPKFKSCPKLSKVDFSSNRLDSSSDTKLVTQLLTESNTLRRINLASCSIEKTSILDLIIDAVRRMKSDDIELNLSNNSAPAGELGWVKAARDCKFKALRLNYIHFKDSVLDQLINTLKALPSLKLLTLDGCKTKPRNTESIVQLAKEFHSLEYLSLSNALDDTSMLCLVNALADNAKISTKTIQKLDISSNHLGDELVAPLVRLIHSSRGLQRINCDGNGLSLSGWQAVYQALRSTAASTHTMQYPHDDMIQLLSWSSSSQPRQVALAKTMLSVQELLTSIPLPTSHMPGGTSSIASTTSSSSSSASSPSIRGVKMRGGWHTQDLATYEVWPTHLDLLPPAPIPSHLASQHTEMKLDDIGDLTFQPIATDIMSANSAGSAGFGSNTFSASSPSLTSSTGSTGSNSHPSSVPDQLSSTPPSSTSMMSNGAGRNRTVGSLRKPSVVDVFASGSPPLAGGTPPPNVSLTGSGGLAVPNQGAQNTPGKVSPPVSPRSNSVSVPYGAAPAGTAKQFGSGSLGRSGAAPTTPTPAMPAGLKRGVPKVPLPLAPASSPGPPSASSSGPGSLPRSPSGGSMSPGRNGQISPTTPSSASGYDSLPHGSLGKSGSSSSIHGSGPPMPVVSGAPGNAKGPKFGGPPKRPGPSHSSSVSHGGSGIGPYGGAIPKMPMIGMGGHPNHNASVPGSARSLPQGNDEFGLYPSSALTFGSYGQVEEEIDAEEPVRRATLNEMVIRLSHESSSDVKFMHTFMLTYRATVEPAELLDRLITRFFSRPPQSKQDGDLKTWFESTLKPIRIRVMNVLKRWCEAHWQDFSNDDDLIDKLESFLKDGTVARQHEASAHALLALIQRERRETVHKAPVNVATLRHRMDADSLGGFGSPTSSSSSSGLVEDDKEGSAGMIGVLAKFSSDEIAEQMCLLECDLFSALQIKEFFNQGWNKGTNEQKDHAAPNIRLMIQVSNQVITWIAHEILRQPTTTARSKAITRAITLANSLMEKKNFNGLKEVTAGLALSSIQRLKKAWSGVKPKFKQMYAELTDKVENMQSLRQLAQSASPPLVPYLGVYLTDLVFIEDGNPNTFEEDGSTFINFRKMSILGEVLMEISSYQHDHYSFFKFDDLYNYLLYLDTHTETELYNMSIAAEPRKK